MPKKNSWGHSRGTTCMLRLGGTRAQVPPARREEKEIKKNNLRGPLTGLPAHGRHPCSGAPVRRKKLIIREAHSRGLPACCAQVHLPEKRNNNNNSRGPLAGSLPASRAQVPPEKRKKWWGPHPQTPHTQQRLPAQLWGGAYWAPRARNCFVGPARPPLVSSNARRK